MACEGSRTGPTSRYFAATLRPDGYRLTSARSGTADPAGTWSKPQVGSERIVLSELQDLGADSTVRR